MRLTIPYGDTRPIDFLPVYICAYHLTTTLDIFPHRRRFTPRWVRWGASGSFAEGLLRAGGGLPAQRGAAPEPLCGAARDTPPAATTEGLPVRGQPSYYTNLPAAATTRREPPKAGPQPKTRLLPPQSHHPTARRQEWHNREAAPLTGQPFSFFQKARSWATMLYFGVSHFRRATARPTRSRRPVSTSSLAGGCDGSDGTRVEGAFNE